MSGGRDLQPRSHEGAGVVAATADPVRFIGRRPGHDDGVAPLQVRQGQVQRLQRFTEQAFGTGQVFERGCEVHDRLRVKQRGERIAHGIRLEVGHCTAQRSDQGTTLGNGIGHGHGR